MNNEYLKQLFILMKPFRWAIIGASILATAVVLSNVGLLATSAVLISLAALMPPILDLMVLIVGVRFFGISRALLRYAERYISHDIMLRILANIRMDLYFRMEPIAPAGLQGYSTGQLFHRLTKDIEVLQYFYLRAVAVPIVATMVFVSSSMFLWQFYPMSAIVFAISMISFGLILPLLFHGYNQNNARLHSNAQEELQILLMDYINGLVDLTANGALQAFRKKIEKQQMYVEQLQKKLSTVSFMVGNGITFGSNLALVTTLILTISQVISQQLSGIYLAMVVVIVWASFEAVQLIPQALIQFEQSRMAAEHIFSIPKVQDEIVTTEVEIPHFGIVFNNVSFAYEKENALYSNLNWECKQGEHIALIGASGSGKSTVLQLLVKFWKPQSGNITLGGIDINEIPDEQLRAHIAVVNQEPYLFHTSIRENLLLAQSNATEKQLWQSLEFALLDEFVKNLPDGLDTFVGENGLKLSGGQRQRLALARVHLQNTPVVILDEALQNLDTITMNKLQENMKEWAKNKTVISMTHTLQNIDWYHQLLLFEQGMVVEQGTKKDLLERKNYFYRLWNIEHRAYQI